LYKLQVTKCYEFFNFLGTIFSAYHYVRTSKSRSVTKNVISFSGSINETAKAWHDNIEEFKTFCSWKSGQEEYCFDDAKKFEKFWFNNANNTYVIDLPNAIKERLLRTAPKTEDEVIRKIHGRKNPRELYEEFPQGDFCRVEDASLLSGEVTSKLTCANPSEV